MSVSEEQINRLRRVKQIHERDLLAKPNVVGVGIGFRERDGQRTEEPAIVVSVTRKMPSALLDKDDLIPAELDGVPVDVRGIGEPRALEES